MITIIISKTHPVGIAVEKTQPIFDFVVKSNSTYEPNNSIEEFESDFAFNVILFILFAF
jgi:hypothetical protein